MISLVLAERQLWKRLNAASEDAGTWIALIHAATKFILIAVAAFFVSGLALLYSNNWTYLKQPWFIVKFGCFLLFTLRGALIGGRSRLLINNSRKKITILPY
jgi:hypothetical protein